MSHTTPATEGSRLNNGTFHNQELPERATVRHALALQIELGRANIHDQQTHPYTNWGWKDRLAHELAGFSDRLEATR